MGQKMKEVVDNLKLELDSSLEKAQAELDMQYEMEIRDLTNILGEVELLQAQKESAAKFADDVCNNSKSLPFQLLDLNDQIMDRLRGVG